MSIFASAKWDSDSDTPFDTDSDVLQTITKNNLGNNIVRETSKHVKNSVLKKAESVKRKKNYENSDKYDQKKTQNGMEKQKSVKILTSKKNSMSVKLNSVKQSKKNIRSDTANSKKKNIVDNRKNAEDLPSQITKDKSIDNKLDTALKKVALYKKLKEIQKTEEDKKLLNFKTHDQEPRKKKYREKLFQVLEEEKAKNTNVLSKKVLTLKQRMEEKLKAARFRFLNEQIYNTNSKEAQKIFEKDPDAFKAYHEGYKQQVEKWPLNPLDVVIRSVNKLHRKLIIADFGCGEAKLAKSVQQKVYSFDLVAFDDSVIACDMAHVPLDNELVDLVVFCLSLMGTNIGDYLMEANRILKTAGTMKIVEVVSRFEDIDEFIKSVQSFGFKLVWKNVTHNYFYFMDFKKEMNVKNKKKLSSMKLNIQPCSYKKR